MDRKPNLLFIFTDQQRHDTIAALGNPVDGVVFRPGGDLYLRNLSAPGAEEVNRRGISLPYFTKDVPELVDQYVAAFEKVWAHRAQLAKT